MNEMTSSSADQQGTMEKALTSLRQEKDQIAKEREEVSIKVWNESFTIYLNI